VALWQFKKGGDINLCSLFYLPFDKGKQWGSLWGQVPRRRWCEMVWPIKSKGSWTKEGLAQRQIKIIPNWRQIRQQKHWPDSQSTLSANIMQRVTELCSWIIASFILRKPTNIWQQWWSDWACLLHPGKALHSRERGTAPTACSATRALAGGFFSFCATEKQKWFGFSYVEAFPSLFSFHV